MELLPLEFLVRLISPSRINTFLTCPKKHDYIYNQELSPIGDRKNYFDKGNYFHELAHVYYQLLQAGCTPGSEYAVAQIIARIKNDVAQLVLPRDAHLVPVYGTISKRIIRFIREQSPKIDAGIEVLHVEHELQYPLSETLALFGYCDLVYRDRAGNLRLRDHKTGEKAWTKGDAKFSNQLLIYSIILWMLLGEIPIAEISFINTRDQAKPMLYEKAFALSTVAYSKRELEIYFKEIGMLIDDMLRSRPIPFYSQHCGYCAFQVPCYLERKGIDPTEIINAHFIKTPRASQRKHRSFSESISEDRSAEDKPN